MQGAARPASCELIPVTVTHVTIKMGIQSTKPLRTNVFSLGTCFQPKEINSNIPVKTPSEGHGLLLPVLAAQIGSPFPQDQRSNALCTPTAINKGSGKTSSLLRVHMTNILYTLQRHFRRLPS
jgi:hypothetical protein